jgi:endonuclease-3
MNMPIELIPDEDMSNGTHDTEEETKKRFEYIINYFQKTNPNPKTELKYKNGYELLVATILSAQATDKRINMTTPTLFEKYPTIDKLAKATPEEVYGFINSVNYANNKSNYLVRMANMVITRYKGKIPEDTEELQNLPGVGRKTAHVIAATLFNKPVIAVDTHVTRVSERIGLTTDAKSPLETEEQLIRYTPKDVMSKISHWLVLHGRYTCMARNPQCKKCEINKVCRYNKHEEQLNNSCSAKNQCSQLKLIT